MEHNTTQPLFARQGQDLNSEAIDGKYKIAKLLFSMFTSVLDPDRKPV